MQKQLTSYLFQHKTCPLPGLGTLSVVNSTAVSDFTNKTFNAPQPLIHFEQKETVADDLLNYLSASTGSAKDEVEESFNKFCTDLKQRIKDQSTSAINNVGSFFVDASGTIGFKQQSLPPAFLQPVIAERVIHPDAEHPILVGDKETTNTVMTELLAPKEDTKERWWIWAIVLGVIAIAAIVIYFTAFNDTSSFGNAINYIYS